MTYGLQMYSVRDFTKEDLLGTLKKVGEIGYKDIEFAGFFGNSAEAIRAVLDENGLVCNGTHTGIGELDNDFAGTVKFGFNTDKPIKATFALEIDGVIVSEFSFEKPENGSFGKEVVMYEQLSAGEHTIRLILTDIKGAGYGSWSAANVTKISIGVAQPQGTETGTEA